MLSWAGPRERGTEGLGELFWACWGGKASPELHGGVSTRWDGEKRGGSRAAPLKWGATFISDGSDAMWLLATAGAGPSCAGWYLFYPRLVWL